MIKTIFICDKCKKQKTVGEIDGSGYDIPAGWIIEFYGGTKHYCSKKCKPRRKVKYVPVKNDDHGVGSLYGRT